MRSAGILLYRRGASGLEVLLGHPGGPYWAGKDAGAWSIPKGEIGAEENPLAAAKREFLEETGFTAEGDAIELAPLKQPSRKWVHIWAVEGDCDPARAHSNLFSMEWPPRSGQMQEFPELDRIAWFGMDEAARRILAGQAPFLAQLARRLDESKRG